MAEARRILVARVTAADGSAETVKQALLRLVGNTRGEKGCIQYDLHQMSKDPKVFIFYEIWATEEDLEAHRNSAFMAAHRQRVAGAVASTVVDEVTFLDSTRGGHGGQS